MILLRQLFRFVDLVRLEARPLPLAAGIVLGLCLGALPPFSPQWLALGLLAVVIRFHPLAVAGAFAFAWLFSPWLDPLFNAVGLYFLKSATLRQLWAWMFHAPLVPYTQFNNSIVMGVIVCCLVAGPPLGLLAGWVVRRHGGAFKAWLAYTGIGSRFAMSPFYRTYAEYRAERLRGWYRPGGLVLVAAALVVGALGYRFFFDDLLKGRLEAQASRVHGARVEIGELRLALFQGTLGLRKIQIANPSDQLRNLAEVDRMDLRFKLKPLLRRKLVFDDFTVSGVTYDTVRTESGALAESEVFTGVANLLERSVTGYYESVREALKHNPLKHLSQLSQGLNLDVRVDRMKGRLESLRSLDAQRARLDELSEKWSEWRRDLPAEGWFAEMAERLKTLPAAKADARERLAEVQAEIRRAAEAASSMAESLAGGLGGAERELAGLGPTLDKDIARIREELSLPDLSSPDLTTPLFGPLILRSLERITYWVDLSRRRMPKGDPTEKMLLVLVRAPRGTDVHYANVSGSPAFLVPEGKLESEGPGDAYVRGRLAGLTTEPSFYGYPTAFTLEASLPDHGIRGVELSGLVDHTRTHFRERLSLRIQEWPVRDVTLHQQGNLTLAIARGTLALTFVASFEEDTLKAEWSAALKDVAYRVNSRFIGEEKILRRILQPLTEVRVEGKVEGNISQLELTTESNLGRTLAERLRREFRHQLGAIDDTIRRSILDHLDATRRGLGARLAALRSEALDAVNRNRDRLEDLSRDAEELKGRLDGKRPARSRARESASRR